MTENPPHPQHADTPGSERPRPTRQRRHAVTAVALIAAVCALAGCGGSSSTVSAPRIAPAKTYSLAAFQPAAPVTAGRATKISFTIHDPSGAPLTHYRTCCDPHAGVDLIVVRSDDSHVQYDDSDIAPDGTVTQPITFPTPGRYRIIIDAYPKQTAPNAPLNFQLFTWVTVRGRYHPPPRAAVPRQRGDRRLPLPDPGSSEAQGDRGELPHHQGDRPRRAQGRVRHLAPARSRTRSSSTTARLLLPHPRVQPRGALLQLGARRDPGERQLERARES